MADIILLSTADWDHPLWTNKQHTALALAEQGHRVLYVESLGLRAPRRGNRDALRIFRRLCRIVCLPRQVAPRVWVWSPPVVPGGQSGWSLALNRRSIQYGLKWIAWWLDFQHWILWTYNPLTALYFDVRSRKMSVYHCVDRIQEQPGMPAERIDVWEERLCRAVQVVFTTSPDLQTSHSRWNHHTYFYGNVADFQHFNRALHEPSLTSPELLDAIPRPRLLFTGAIDAYKLDISLMVELARAHSNWSFVFVGPVGEADPSTDVAALRTCPNVHIVGSRPYQDLPAWAAHSDLALLPLQQNGYTRHMFPMKFFEYLSAGLPVVGTAIPALKSHSDVAWLCEPDAVAFASAIDRALKGQGPSLSKRLARAHSHTYSARTKSMLNTLLRLGVVDEAQKHNQKVFNVYLSGLNRTKASLISPLMKVVSCTADYLVTLGCQQSVIRQLNFFESRGWLPPDLQSRLACLYVRNGAYSQALALLEQLWQVHGRADVIQRLLFRRSSRPQGRYEALKMFEVFASSSHLPEYLTGYCWIVFAHRCADVGDKVLMRRALVGVEALAERLEAEPDIVLCLRSNRRNRFKMLVSCYAALLRLQLAFGNAAALKAVGRAGLALMQRFDPAAIDANTSYRLTRNSLRVLSIVVLEAVESRDFALLDSVTDAMESQHQHIHQSCFDDQTAQEDHRRFASSILNATRSIPPTLEIGLDACGRDAVEKLLVLVINSERDLDDPQRQPHALAQSKALFASFWSGTPPFSTWS